MISRNKGIFSATFLVSALGLIVAVRGVTQGCGYRIRALTVYERAQDELPGLEVAT